MLTAALPQSLARWLAEQRAQLQPEAARRAPPHLSLFRHLPGLQLPELLRDIRRIARETMPISLMVERPKADGDMLFCPVRAPALDELRAELAWLWRPLLAGPDRAPPALHLTIARRLPPQKARVLARTLLPPPDPSPAKALLLWRYDQSCWSPLVAIRLGR